MEGVKTFAMVLGRSILPKDIRHLIISKCIVKRVSVAINGYKEEWFELFGVKNGLCRGWWSENGQLEFESMYKDGKQNGLCRCWHENGQLLYEGMFKDGGRNGLCRWWSENGQLEYESMYKDGKVVN